MALRDEAREYIDMAIAFANQPATAAQDAVQLMLDRFLIQCVHKGPEPKVKLPDGRSVNWDEWLHEHRRWTREALGRIADGKTLTRQQEQQLTSFLRGVRIRLDFTKGRLTMRDSMHFTDVMAGVALGIALLIETGSRPRQCEECGAFLVPEKGRQRASYCRACMADVKARQNRERVSAKRAGMPVQEWRKVQRQKQRRK